MTQLLPDAATLARHAQQYPDFARWLQLEGITSISLNPDTVIATWNALAEC